MRIDKYLKVARIIKRRTIANEACDSGRISVNGKTVKASYEVKIGDELSISMGGKIIKVEVLQTAEHILKGDASTLFRILE